MNENNIALNLASQISNDAPEPTKTIAELAEESHIPQGVIIPEPELIFALNGIPLFTKKSLSVLKGPAKVGKTTVTAWITAQTINNQLNVLWIDTEQGLYYGSRTQYWVLSIAGTPKSPYLNFYDLKIYNPTVRIKIVEHLLLSYKPDIVILDGIRDLVFDINSPEEATNITGDLMRWADVYDCHVLSIIHQNKGSDHARGHLGSELVNKAETVIKVSKSEDNYTVCEPEFTRGKPFEVFAFDRDSYGIPILVTVKPRIDSGESNSRKTTPVDIAKETHNEILQITFKGIEQMSYSDLQNDLAAAFAGYGTTMGVVKIKTFISWYTQNGYLEKSEKKSNKTFYQLK